MKYAPILITTLCRYEHFVRCITSLQKNKQAGNTDIYIGLDYPSKDSHQEGYERIKKYIMEDLKGFSNIYLVKQTENQGWYRNFVLTRKKLYEKHDRFIYSEDDNEFSPNFLSYMNLCLERYEKDEGIYAISGYTYPIAKLIYSGNVYKNSSYFSANGYGIWKSKEESMYSQLTIENFERLFYNHNFINKLKKSSLNQYCNFVRGMLEYRSELIKFGDIQKIDLAFGINMLATNRSMIFPTVSKVKNWGYDGSGMNCHKILEKKSKKICHRNFDYSKQPLDLENHFVEINVVDDDMNDSLHKAVNDFFWVSRRELIRTNISYYLARLLGRQCIIRILRLK